MISTSFPCTQFISIIPQMFICVAIKGVLMYGEKGTNGHHEPVNSAPLKQMFHASEIEGDVTFQRIISLAIFILF